MKRKYSFPVGFGRETAKPALKAVEALHNDGSSSENILTFFYQLLILYDFLFIYKHDIKLNVFQKSTAGNDALLLPTCKT